MFLRVFILLLFSVQLCRSTDTITPNKPLKDGDVLISEGGKFSLGFFTPGNSSHRYVGIWFAKISVQTVEWVANRNKPISGLNGVMSIDTDGNLSIMSLKSVIWSTNVSKSGLKNDINSTSCRLLNSGNLVLSTDNEEDVVWQSFDYMTDNFLAGMTFGVDKRTGFNWYLTSWASKDDPSPGDYTYRVNPEGSGQLFLYQGSKPVWRSGPFVGKGWSGVPEMSPILNYSFINTPDAAIDRYSLINDSIISTLLVDGSSGTIIRRTWQEDTKSWSVYWTAPKEFCDQYGECGAYGICNPNSGNQYQCSCFPGYQPKSPRDWYVRDGSEGCVREANRSMCRNGEGFLRLASVKVPDTSKAAVNTIMTLKQCEQECLTNCSCTGYTTADVRGMGSGCLLIFGELIDTRMYPDGGQDLYFRADAIEIAKYGKSQGPLANKRLEATLIVLIVLICLVLVTSTGFCVYQKKKQEREEEMERSLWTIDAEEGDSNAELPFYSRNEITTATDNFSLANKLGQGGFGSVYKGRLHNGQEVAVKRLNPNSGQGIHEFKNEIRLIAKLQHRNLVKMLGCCVQGDEKLLIYEYMPNKSLDSYIFKEENRALLDWRKLFEIIMGIARGMLYLHQDSRLRIIHRDLKASNILLDKDMVPKISDFGMARIFGGEEIEANTTRVVGTYGYMAPEYALEGLISIKSDVFSFGVLLLEVVTGRKNSGIYADNPSINLVGHVWDLWKGEKTLEIVNTSLLNDHENEEELLKSIQVGLLCVQECADDRPTISEVLFMLSTQMELPSPNQPAFIHKGRNDHDVNPSSSSVGAYSVNEMSITAEIDGR